MKPTSDKSLWVRKLYQGEPMKDGLARLIEVDHDEAETSYYEDSADPTFVTRETARRRYRGMFRRRMRHLENKKT